MKAPLVSQVVRLSLRIRELDFREAMSSSVALNRPERNFGAIMPSSASNFTEWSARVYISVVCMCACPSQSETFLRSLVACNIVSAQVCRSTCGDMRFADSDGHRTAAARTCLCRMYSNPDRVIGSPRALRNSSGAGTVLRTASHARNALAVSFHKGKQRCFRPFPCTRTLGYGWSCRSVSCSPINSETRKPAAKQR